MLKRYIDVAGGVVGVCITGTIYPFIAVAIKLDSPGPVIYRQRRVGYQGQEFWCYKFRTRTVDADERQEKSHEEIAADRPYRHNPNDPMVTRVGKFLRQSSLNELPQFYNVLCGEMSLVGPRPTLPPDVKHYPYRQAVKPGLTSLWQVSGRASITDEEGVFLDRYYIGNQSLWLDLRILLRTVKAVFSRRGAA